MTLANCRAKLDARLVSLAGINTSSISWPGVAFQPPANAAWYKVDLIPTGVDPEISGPAHEKGIYQVAIFTPAGVGSGTLLGLADAVIGHFDRKDLTGVATGVPVAGPLQADGAWVFIPVQIPFQTL